MPTPFSEFHKELRTIRENIKTEKMTVAIEDIDPEQAKYLLNKNFENNRNIVKSQVTKLVTSMRKDIFYCSSDAIAIDEDGNLVNGQHRMSAVAQSGVTCEFLVVRGFPREHVKCIDLGRKRMMDDRIQIAGVPIARKDCNVVRNCFSDYNSKILGVNSYAQLYHDNQVIDWYKTMDKFLGVLDRLNCKSPGFMAVGAIYILTDLTNDYIRHKVTPRYAHIADQALSPLVRALQFAEYSVHGELDKTGAYVKDRDGSAKTLYDGRIRYNSEKKYWSTFERLNMTLTLASSFAENKNVKKMGTTQRRPFNRLDRYSVSPNDCLDFCLQDHPEKLEEHFNSDLMSFLESL